MHRGFISFVFVYLQPRWGPRGPGPTLGPIFSFFVIIFFIFVVSSFQNIRPHFFTTSLTSLTQIAIIQPKNLTKTIQIFTMVIVF